MSSGRYSPRQLPDTAGWVCRRCGCTERVACPGGCWWVGPQLCSGNRCATPEQHYIHAAALKDNQLPELLRGTFKLPKHLQLHVPGLADKQERARERESVRATERSDREYKKVIKAPGRGRRLPVLDAAKLLKHLDTKHGLDLSSLEKELGVSMFVIKRTMAQLILKKLALNVGPPPRKGRKGRLPNRFIRVKKVTPWSEHRSKPLV